MLALVLRFLRAHAAIRIGKSIWVVIGVSRSAVETLSQLAIALDTSVEALIGLSAKHGIGRRGPAPKLQQQLERITQLPKAKQRFVMQMLDNVLQQASQGPGVTNKKPAR